MAVLLEQVFADPHGVAESLVRGISAVEAMTVQSVTPTWVRFTIRLYPEGVFAAKGYPVENVKVLIGAMGKIHTVPLGEPDRIWRHRNLFGARDLCLWYVNDPPSLRWSWGQGLEVYVRMVHRHLIDEEFYRRHRYWPVEDAPHG